MAFPAMLLALGLGGDALAGSATPPALAVEPETRAETDARIAGVLAGLPDPGTTTWNARARHALLTTYDTDQSGQIDDFHELDDIGCVVWSAMDHAVRGRWADGLWVVYGVGVGQVWQGGALGLAPEVRRQLDRRLQSCRLVDPALLARQGQTRPVDERLRAIGPSVDPRWEDRVSVTLRGAFDDDSSGLIDSMDEVLAVPCAAWAVLDSRLRDQGGPGLAQQYGVTNLGALGISPLVADTVGRAVRGCDLQPAPIAFEATADPAGLAVALRALPAVDPQVWEPAIRRALLATYDVDRDELLATASEVQAIPCDVWLALDLALRQGQRVSLIEGYGFAAGQTWLGYSLGLHASTRVIATDAITACGLARPARADERTARTLSGLRDAGRQVWFEAASEVLRGAYDANLDGVLDGREIGRIGCGTWSALAEGAHTPGGLPIALGLGGPSRVGRLAFGAEAGPAVEEAIGHCAVDPRRDAPLARAQLAAKLWGLVDRAGTDSWDRDARDLLVAALDVDLSGAVDTREEAGIAGCDAWRALDAGVRAGWGRGMLSTFGFVGPGPWWGDAVGFGWRAHARVAHEVRRCGVPADRGG